MGTPFQVWRLRCNTNGDLSTGAVSNTPVPCLKVKVAGLGSMLLKYFIDVLSMSVVALVDLARATETYYDGTH